MTTSETNPVEFDDAPFQAAEILRQRLPGFVPRVAMILGSGLGTLADAMPDAQAIPYAELAGFPRSSVAGHAGELVLGHMAGVPVACMKGRGHVYEGQGLQVMTGAVRALKLLGCEILLATNAVGSLRAHMPPGGLAVVSDHINMLPGSPMMGANDERFGPRFFSMANAYDAGLRAALQSCAQALDIALPAGVYVALPGPSFETPAEIRMLERLGGDLVGMSLVPEVISARHCGMQVLAVSAVTNMAEGLTDVPLSHEQTLAFAAQGVEKLLRLVPAWLARLAPLN